MTYHWPDSLKDAINLIRTGAVPLAGGTVLVSDILNFRIKPEKIVDLRYLNELRGIKLDDTYVEIGALTTIDEMTECQFFNSGEFKAFKLAASSIGNPQVRRVGTVGGNILWNSPGADLRPVFYCFDGEVLVSLSDEQNKWIPVEQLWSSLNASPLLISKFRFAVKKGFRSGFKKFAWRKSSGKTIVNIAVNMDFKEGTFQNIKIVVGGIANNPVNLEELGEKLSNNLSALQESLEVDYLKKIIPANDSTPGYNYRIKLAAYGIQEVINEILNE